MITFRIRELLEESKKNGKKVTQTGLAKAAGTSQTTIWKIVEGKTKAPDPQILLIIAGVFTEALGREVTIDDLIEKQDREAAITPPEPRSIEDKIDKLNQQIAGVRGEIAEMRQDVNQQIAGVRNEIGKLNQNEQRRT